MSVFTVVATVNWVISGSTSRFFSRVGSIRGPSRSSKGGKLLFVDPFTFKSHSCRFSNHFTAVSCQSLNKHSYSSFTNLFEKWIRNNLEVLQYLRILFPGKNQQNAYMARVSADSLRCCGGRVGFSLRIYRHDNGRPMLTLGLQIIPHKSVINP